MAARSDRRKQQTTPTATLSSLQRTPDLQPPTVNLEEAPVDRWPSRYFIQVHELIGAYFCYLQVRTLLYSTDLYTVTWVVSTPRTESVQGMILSTLPVAYSLACMLMVLIDDLLLMDRY